MQFHWCLKLQKLNQWNTHIQRDRERESDYHLIWHYISITKKDMKNYIFFIHDATNVIYRLWIFYIRQLQEYNRIRQILYDGCILQTIRPLAILRNWNYSEPHKWRNEITYKSRIVHVCYIHYIYCIINLSVIEWKKYLPCAIHLYLVGIQFIQNLSISNSTYLYTITTVKLRFRIRNNK